MKKLRTQMFATLQLIVSQRFVIAAIVLTLCSSLVVAQSSKPDFTFVNVVDSTQGLHAFSQFPAINNLGTVAFIASDDNQFRGVFKSEGRTLTKLASESDHALTFIGDDVVINVRGVVAYEANIKAIPGDRAIFTTDGLVTKTVVDTTTLDLVGRFLGSPSINDQGTVAFAASRKDFSRVILTGNGGELSTIFDTAGTEFSGVSNVAINNAGNVPFVGVRPDGSQELFIATRTGDITPITDKDTLLSDPFVQLGDPVINAASTVADEAFLANGNVEVFSGTINATTAKTDPNSSLLTFSEHPSINNRGAVAFFATDVNGNQAIFVAEPGNTSPIAVVQSGDELFGSTVTGLDLGRFGLNDRDQLVFHYDLQDGRSGIAIVSLKKEEKMEHQNGRS